MAKKTVYPLLEENWQSVAQRAEEMGGGPGFHRNAMLVLRAKRIEELAATLPGDPQKREKDATRQVEETFIGIRALPGGKSDLAASPEAQVLLPAPYPALEEGWQTTTMIRDNFRMHLTRAEKLLSKLRETLIEENMQQRSGKLDEAERRRLATELVDKKYIGMRQKDHKGVPLLSASPKALERLAIPPFMEEGWATGSMLRVQKGGGGNNDAYDNDIRVLRRQLIDDIVESSTDKEHPVERPEAIELADHHLAGMRRKKDGVGAMAASPDAQRIMNEPEESGWKRRLKRPNASKNDPSSQRS